MTISYSDAAIMSAIDGMLKEDWISSMIHDQYGREMPILALLEKTSENVEGTDAVVTMRMSPNTSTGARSEMDDLPDPGRQTTKKVRMGLAFWYTPCAFSGQAIKASKSNAGSLARVITDELETGVKDHKRVENFFMFGDGNGSLARVTAIDTLTLTLDRWPTLLCEGRKIDTFTARSAGSAGGVGLKITAANRSAKTITCDAVTSVNVGDYVYLKKTRGVVNMGLMGIADDGTFVPTFQTLSRATYPKLKAKVFGASSPRTLSEDILLDVIARMREDGAKPNLMIGTSFQLRDLCSEAKEQRRFIDPKTKIDLGITGISIGDGVDFTFDADNPAGYCFSLDKEAIKIIEADPLGFMDKDGNVLSRIPGKDGYEAVLFHYYNLVALSCFNQCRIEDLVENRVGD